MGISDKGIEFIKKFEGCELKAYQDSVGIWTIGYGHTQHVRRGDMITLSTADGLLRNDLAFVEQVIASSVSVSLTQNQTDALTSFIFNLGGEKFKSSTLLKKINSGDNEGAAGEFLHWDHAGGKELQGLLQRRKAERDLFIS